MLFNLWLASTGACIAVDTISVLAFVSKLKREGYEYKNTFHSLSEALFGILHLLPVVAIPVLNIFNSVRIVKAIDEKYELLKELALEKGDIVKINEFKSPEELIAEIHEKRDELEELKAALSKYNTGDYVFSSEIHEEDSLATDEHSRTFS